MGRRVRKSVWIALASIVFTLVAPGTVSADATPGGVTLSSAEATMLEANPALSALATTSPQLLRQVLDRIAKLIANPSDARGGLQQLTEEDWKLLQQNPALFQAWRSSPEASADLLELIRVAAGGKPRK